MLSMSAYGLAKGSISFGEDTENNSESDFDKIEVYDSSDTKLLDINYKKNLDYFSELIGNTANNVNDNGIKKVPDDAEVSYKYEFETKSKDGRNKVYKVDFYVYSNYPYITLDGIPIVSPLTWELSKKQNLKLQNPEKIK